MEIREQDPLQNIHNSLKWKSGSSNLGIKLKQIFRVLAGYAPAPLKWQLKEACFSRMKQDLTQPVFNFT